MGIKLYGGIEAGGTKFSCAVGTSPDEIIDQLQIPTTSPAETLEKVIDFFRNQPHLEAIGIASFGPLDISEQSPTYGFITTTPKKGWAQTDLVGIIGGALNVPVVFNTDVNGAALAEYRYGAGKGLSSLAYMTVGTGIGIGCIVNDQILSGGLSHTEMGHMLIPFRANDLGAVSACPYHGNCLEGLASGTALKLRTGVSAENLNDPEAWDLEAYYLAQGLVNIITTIMPMRIVIGGGVTNHPKLLDDIRPYIPKILNGYLQIPEILENIDDYIVLPKLGAMSGVIGAIALGMSSL